MNELDGICAMDLLLTTTDEAVATTVEMLVTTAPNPCSDLTEDRLLPLHNCTQHLEETTQTFSAADWRDDRKTRQLCG
jgi:hypothetical protein